MPERVKPDKPLLDKLGVKTGMRMMLVGVEDEPFLQDLGGRGVGVVSGEEGSSDRDASYDAIFVAINEPPDLEQLARLRRAVKPNGAVWAVFRKGRKDFNENDVLRGGLAAGLVDVKVVRFSDTHTASKFVIRKAERV
jgi:hypothetical protein